MRSPHHPRTHVRDLLFFVFFSCASLLIVLFLSLFLVSAEKQLTLLEEPSADLQGGGGDGELMKSAEFQDIDISDSEAGSPPAGQGFERMGSAEERAAS